MERAQTLGARRRMEGLPGKAYQGQSYQDSSSRHPVAEKPAEWQPCFELKVQERADHLSVRSVFSATPRRMCANESRLLVGPALIEVCWLQIALWRGASWQI